MNPIKSFIIVSFLIQPLFAKETVLPNAIQTYNSFTSLHEIYGVMATNASEADQQFIKELQAQMDTKAMPKAKVQGNLIFVEGLKKPLEVVSVKTGDFIYDGKDIKIDVNMSVEKNLMQIQKAMTDKAYSKFSLLVTEAHASDVSNKVAAEALKMLVRPLTPVLAVYAVGAAVTSTGCAVLGFGAGGANLETAKDVASTCPEVGLKWPYHAYKLLVGAKGESEIKSGECLKSQDGHDVVKFETANKGQGLMIQISKNRDSFATVLKSKAVAGKANSLVVETLDQSNKLPSQLNIEADTARLYLNNLALLCQKGGTALLNKTIKQGVALRQGMVAQQKSSSEGKPATQPAAEKSAK